MILLLAQDSEFYSVSSVARYSKGPRCVSTVCVVLLYVIRIGGQRSGVSHILHDAALAAGMMRERDTS